MQLSCFFTLKRSYQSIKHESQFGQEGEAQSNAPATSARPPPRPAPPVASPPAAVKGEATSLLCCSFGLVMSHYPSPFSGFKRKCAHTGTRRSEPRVAPRERCRRRVSRTPRPGPPCSPRKPSCVRATTGGEFGHCLAAGRLARPPAPLLPEAPYQCPPAPHRSAVRRGVGGARCDVPGIVSHREARLRADRRLSARPG